MSEKLMENGELIVENGGSAWREIEINEVIDKANTGLDAIKRAPIVEENTGIKCMRIQDVSQNKSYEKWGFTKVEEKNYEKFQLKKNDIIIARTGATVGVNKFIYSDLKSVFNNGLIRIKTKNDVCLPRFLYYHFRTDVFRSFIESISGGTSSQPNMQINVLLSYDISLPPLPEQKAIAEVLSALDDKIDLLHRQNKTLEQMAETLFRQWFVVEAGEDWEEGVLPDEFDFLMGQSPKGSSFNEVKVGMPMFQGNADFGFRFPSERIYTTEPKRLAQPLDTLISVRAPVGAQNMAEKECCIGRGVAAFRYKENHDFYTYTYFKLESLMEEIKKFNDEGTVFGSISKGDFQKMEIVIPPDDLVKKFETNVKPINDKVIKNCGQIRTLQSLRDTLLPKLMSGEIRVKYDGE